MCGWITGFDTGNCLTLSICQLASRTCEHIHIHIPRKEAHPWTLYTCTQEGRSPLSVMITSHDYHNYQSRLPVMIANIIPLAAKTPIREMLSTSQQLQFKSLGTLEAPSTCIKLSVYSCTSVTKELLQVLWFKIAGGRRQSSWSSVLKLCVVCWRPHHFEPTHLEHVNPS